MLLQELWTYPVKGLAGVRLAASRAGERGLEHDRRFLLATRSGELISQRDVPAMCRLAPRVVGETVVVEDLRGGREPLVVPLAPRGGEPVSVTLWGQRCRGATVSAAADGWLREALRVDCRLVHQPVAAERFADPAFAPRPTRISFADAFPYLVIGQGSLDELASRSPEPLSMRRFRPNLVIAGAAPFAEDGWGPFTVGGVSFCAVKPCPRCPVTTIDPDTGAMGKEPLRTLATFRRWDGSVWFGQNAIAAGEGWLREGDPVVAEPRQAP